MRHPECQGHQLFSSGEEDFEGLFSYMRMAAILFM